MRVKKIGFVFAAALLAGATVPMSGVQANTYDFSYTFSDVPNCCAPASPYTGYTIVGSFTGTPSGLNDVISISNVNAELLNASNVVVIPSLGTLSVYSYLGPANNGGPSNFQLGGAVASFNGLDNNFLFANSATFGAWTNYFYIIQPWNNGGPGSTTIAAQFVSPSVGIDAYNGQYFPGLWSLTAVATPLPSTWLMLLSGFVGLGFFAYRGAKKNASVLAAA
jgi:hypothetical protein